MTGRISCLANSIIFIFYCIVDSHPGVLSVFLSRAVSLSARVHPCLRTCTAGQRIKEGGPDRGLPHLSDILTGKKGKRNKETFHKSHHSCRDSWGRQACFLLLICPLTDCLLSQPACCVAERTSCPKESVSPRLQNKYKKSSPLHWTLSDHHIISGLPESDTMEDGRWLMQHNERVKSLGLKLQGHEWRINIHIKYINQKNIRIYR